MYVYIGAIVRAAHKSGLLYTTSEKREGYLILSDEGVGTIGFADGMKMIFAEKKDLPVILDTDDRDKSLRYQHLGMKPDRVRNCGERFHMYDLTWEG